MSLYRNALWFLNGIQHYTRKGFEAASQDFNPQHLDVSVVGRSFMITGANSGIGRATAAAIAKKGGTVHMVCRDRDKGERARVDIVNDSGNTEVYVHILDMSETQKVWEFAEDFKKKHSSLNVLINNAGCMVHQRQVNTEGLEKNFATNTMGVYVLTQSLVPLLLKSRDPRVRQQVVLTRHWAKVHPAIHFSVMHPGWVDTPAVSKSMPQFHQMMGERLRTAEQGADTVVWLAVSRAAARTRSGQFFQDRKAIPVHLPLAWTRSSAQEIESFMTQLEELARPIQRPIQDPEPDGPVETALAETA